MNILPPFTVWFVIAATILCAYLFVRLRWSTHTGSKIILVILTIMGLIILYDNHTI